MQTKFTLNDWEFAKRRKKFEMDKYPWVPGIKPGMENAGE